MTKTKYSDTIKTIMALGKVADDTLDEELQAIANENNVLIMSFVAPDSIVKKSPASYDYAKITIKDLYKIEAEVTALKEQGRLPKKLHLIIQTPGGSLDASVKIAKYLQAVFSEIEAYVPYEAASGGTMLCLAARTIVMDLTSDLTPIDPQVIHEGQRIAASSYEQAIHDFQEKFSTQSPREIPSPYQQMGNKFDPVVQKEMDKIVWDTIIVASELLKKSQKAKTAAEKSKVYSVVFKLGKTDQPHSHIISVEEAKEIGLNISQDKDKMNLLKTYKKWVSSMLDQEETTHIIKTYCPEPTQQKLNTETEPKSNESEESTNA